MQKRLRWLPLEFAVSCPVAPPPSARRLPAFLWSPGFAAACALAAGCSATPLQAEPSRAAPRSASAASAAEPLHTAGVAPQSVEPMDALRERLAEKLNVSKTKDATGAQALRVSGHEAQAKPAEPAASSARRAPRSTDKRYAAAARAGALLPRTAAGPWTGQWDYQGSGGPQSWGQLKPEFAVCGSGRRQSPIDIRDGIRVQLDAVRFDYRPSAFSVVDNGHTVQVKVEPGNSIQVQGRRYDLIDMDFHRPSEERINGRAFDMAVHLVHRDPDGRLAVIAVLFDRGTPHPIVQAVWNNLPLEKGDEVPAQAPLDVDALLPRERSYYTYMGSLTAPPCSEGVLWMVMKNPVPISAEQVAIFSRLYPMNARPVQAAAGRLIKESN